MLDITYCNAERCNYEKCPRHISRVSQVAFVSTANCKGDAELCPMMDLWKHFCGMPVDNEGCITEAWNGFAVGTHRQDILDWFSTTFQIDWWKETYLQSSDVLRKHEEE